ncbi:hypothetical protein [Streptomyces sp. DH24]|uniref:hypothetical protein n=1 Tax=Streptomyces sp. DH24 TaxID=3040123 RepID=UPI0024417728|nr:hypothetical protein [Streptomyces sp. DH24]MDG9719619.1 hypothetical protein [Streptomyces sp. DH24]
MRSAEHKTLPAVVWLLVALVVLGVGAASASEIGGALERERDYRAAPECASVPVRASGCLWEQAFTVREAATNHGKKGAPPEAVLLLPSGKPWEVTFRQTDPVVSEMEPDDKVVGLIWHGRVVEVRDADGRRQQTSSGPVGWPADRLGGALACISLGLAALVGALWSLIARGNARHQAAASVVRWHGVGMGATAILTLWAQEANDWPMWAIPAIWGPIALIILLSMVAFALAGVRGELRHDAPPTPGDTPPPAPADPPPLRLPGGTTGPSSGHP